MCKDGTEIEYLFFSCAFPTILLLFQEKTPSYALHRMFCFTPFYIQPAKIAIQRVQELKVPCN